MTNRAVMQQALEALIDAANVLSAPMFADAADALRTALAQPEQEPVPEKEWIWIYGTPLLDAMTQDFVPSQRPWQGLTDEEVQFYIKKHSKLVNAGYDKVTETNLIAEEFNSIGFYKEVSAALKERNT